MKKPLILAVVFLMGGISFFILSRASGVFGEWRTIQVIKTGDRRHTAELRRLYGYIDVNFRLILDGKKIYHSPDFAPAYDKPFREWITWDEGQKNIVFLAADQVLFAYRLDTGESVPAEAFSSLAIPRYTLSDIGYEGDHPGKKR